MGDRLATIDMGRKLGGGRFGKGDLGPHVTQCGLGPGLPSYHLDSSSRLVTTEMGRHLEGAVHLRGGAGSASNTMLPGTRPEAYHRTKWHLDPSSRMATTNICRKLRGCAPFWEGKLWVPI